MIVDVITLEIDPEMNADSKLLSTNCLEITDPDTGKVGIRMTVRSGVPTVELRDKEGFQRLTVTIDNYPKIVFQNQDGSGTMGVGGMDQFGYGVMITNQDSGSAALVTADEGGELKVIPIASEK